MLTPAVLISMVVHRQFSHIWRCVLAYTLGLCLVLIPVFTFLIATHCLADMWELYIHFNFTYTGYMASGMGLLSTALYLLNSIPFLVPIIMLSILASRHQTICRINLLALVTMLILSSISGRSTRSIHYALPLLPFLFVPLAAILNSLSDAEVSARSDGRPMHFSRCIYPAFTLALILYGLNSVSLDVRDSAVPPSVSYLRENTLPADDVLIIGNDCKNYILSERYTHNRFIYQYPPVEISDDLYEEFLNELEIHPSDVVLVRNTVRSDFLAAETRIGEICRLLDSMYLSGAFSLEVYDDFYVYRRIQA